MPNLIIEDQIRKTKKIFYQCLNDDDIVIQYSINYKNPIDNELHDFVVTKIGKNNYDRLILPASLGDYHTNYYGIRTALHIRLTEELALNRFIPIILYSPDFLQDILRFEKLAIIVATPGCMLVNIGLDSLKLALDTLKSPITELQFKEFVDAIHPEPPGTFLSSQHSLANEWGVYHLDILAETYQLNTNNMPNFKTLYFKWLQAKYNAEIGINFESQGNSEEITEASTRRYAGVKRIKLDDEKQKILNRNLGQKK